MQWAGYVIAKHFLNLHVKQKLRIRKVLRKFPEVAFIVNSAFFPLANNIFEDKIFQWKVFDLFDIDFICMQTNSDVSIPSLHAK